MSKETDMPLSISRNYQQMVAGLNLIQQGLSIYDDDLRLVISNNRFREMFNLPKELCSPGAHFEDTIRYIAQRGEYGTIDDIEAFVRDRVTLALAFEPHYIERRQGDQGWLSVEGSPLPNGGWVTVYTDITQAKHQEALLRARSEELSDQLLERAEELAATNRKLEATITALEEAKRQLTEIEARTRLTTEMMPAHIAHVGPDRHYIYSNRKLPDVMPGSQNKILGQHIRYALGDQAYEAIRPHLNAAFDGTPSVFEFNHENSSRRIRTAFTPDNNPEPDRGVYILSMDITEETQTRAALQQTRRRELAAQMTSGLAHDFSNLLTIILGMQGKLQRMDLPSKAEDLVEATLTAARRGGTLLNSIADMTNPRTAKLKPVFVGSLLQELQILARPTLSPDVAMVIDNQIPDDPMMLDSGMLQDSLLNLILNASHACGECGEIHLRAEVIKDTWVQFVVSDTGTGFSEDALQNGLAPFFTTKGEEGSGLGLAMVYDMTKLSGGEVRLDNSPVGACVTLRLPLRRPSTNRAPGLVLMVEDSADLRLTIREMLTTLGHTVIEATSVDEGLALFEQVPDISLVLSDISLEGEKTGVDLLRKLPRNGTPRYLMTSLPQSHPLHQEAAAIAPVLPKPFSTEDLSVFLNTEGVS